MHGGGLRLDWAFAPENQFTVTGWGFWFGLVGLLVSVVGFGITLYQLKQTKSAAVAAQQESERIKGVLRQYDAAQEAARAQYALTTARKHFERGNWPDGAESYEHFRRGLLSLKRNMDWDMGELSELIDAAGAYVEKLCERVDRDVQRGNTTISYAKTAAVMRQHDQLISDITIALERSSF